MQILLQVCPTLLKQDAFLQQLNSDDLFESESTQRIASRQTNNAGQARWTARAERDCSFRWPPAIQDAARRQPSKRWGKAR